jgi:hypothetical protein
VRKPEFEREDIVSVEGDEYRVGFHRTTPVDFGPLPTRTGYWFVLIGAEWVELLFAPEHFRSSGMPLARLLEPHIRLALRERRRREEAEE